VHLKEEPLLVLLLKPLKLVLVETLKKAFIVGSTLTAVSTFALTTAFAADTDAVPVYGVPGTTRERTFIAVKPDGVQRGLVGEVISRFERKGYQLVAMKLEKVSKEHAEKHYIDLKDKPFYGGLCDYMSSGPLVAMVWQGKNIVKGGRTLIGATNPQESAPGTIRGDFCIDVGRNMIHGSDTVENANKEIALWFGEKELVDWTPCEKAFVYEKV